MAELIKIQREEPRPQIVCPHCKSTIAIDIKPFAPDPTKIMEDKCIKCGGSICVGLLILSHKSMRQLLIAIQAVITTLNTGNLIVGKN
jgi:hypothetical protein